MEKVSNFNSAINHVMRLIETVDGENLQDELLDSLDEVYYYYDILSEDRDNLKSLLEEERDNRWVLRL